MEDAAIRYAGALLVLVSVATFVVRLTAWAIVALVKRDLGKVWAIVQSIPEKDYLNPGEDRSWAEGVDITRKQFYSVWSDHLRNHGHAAITPGNGDTRTLE